MIVKACPRCFSVTNVKPSHFKKVAAKGGLRCDWCGYSFHESELVPLEVPGEEKVTRREKPLPQPYWFDEEKAE